MRVRPLRPPYRVIIVEDHKFVAEMLAQRLALDSAVQVVGIANFGSSALHLISQHPVDIVLLDMQLESEDGIGIAKQLWAQNPELRIIGLSVHDADYHPVALLEIGGMGFLSKRTNAKEISEAIRRVANGDLAISPQIAVHLATRAPQASPIEQLRALTTKEVEVLSEIAHGFSVREIAQRAGLTEKTIQTHRSNMRKKLHATTDVQLCLIAIKAGLVDIHQATA
jgi:DNA-binding NarL/FixJ family response regulator